MNTKTYLQQIDRFNQIIENKKLELDDIEEKYSMIPSPSYDERVQSSKDLDKLGRTIASIVDYKDELLKCIESHIEKRKVIVEQIQSMSSMDNDYYNILFKRYVLKYTFTKIADNIYCSERQVIREHGKALLEFEKLWGDTYIKL